MHNRPPLNVNPVFGLGLANIINANAPVVNNAPAALDEKQDSISEYLKYIKTTARDVLGQFGMLQHHFNSKAEADLFATWLKSQNSLKPLQIDKAKPQEFKFQNEKVFIVRISEAQFDAMMGKGSFAKIMPENVLEELATSLQDFLDKADYTGFRDAINVKSITESELNQKRLFYKLKGKTEANLLEHVLKINDSQNCLVTYLINGFSSRIIKLELEKHISTIVESPQLLQLFISLISPASLYKILDDTGGLTWASHNFSEVVFNQLIERNGNLNAIVLKEVKDNFHDFGELEEKKFIKIFQLLNPDQIGPILSQVNNCCKNTFLYEVLKNQSEKALLALIAAASPESLGIGAKTLVGRDTIFHDDKLISSVSDKVYLAIIEKIPSKTLDEIMEIPSSMNDTPLVWLPRSRLNLVNPIIQLISSASLSAASKKTGFYKGVDILYYLLQYGNPQAIATFFTKIDDEALKKLLKPDPIKPVAQNHVTKIADGLLNEPAWQTPELSKCFFDLMGAQLAPLCLNHWVNGKELSPANHTGAIQHLAFLTKDEEEAFKAYKPHAWHQHPILPSEIHFIETSTGEKNRNQKRRRINPKGLGRWFERLDRISKLTQI